MRGRTLAKKQRTGNKRRRSRNKGLARMKRQNWLHQRCFSHVRDLTAALRFRLARKFSRENRTTVYLELTDIFEGFYRVNFYPSKEAHSSGEGQELFSSPSLLEAGDYFDGLILSRYRNPLWMNRRLRLYITDELTDAYLQLCDDRTQDKRQSVSTL